MKERRRYRMVENGCDGELVRVLVAKHHGFEGYWCRYTTRCSGCSDADYATESGAGCRECGYTGKRRVVFFRAFEDVAFERWIDERWKRRERLLTFWKRNRAA